MKSVSKSRGRKIYNDVYKFASVLQSDARNDACNEDFEQSEYILLR